MPTYEFKCENCGRITTEDHSIVESIPSMITCKFEGCEAKARRVFSAPAVHFKGKGFYTTDYRKQTKPGVSTDTKTDSQQEIKKAADKVVDKSPST